MQLHYERFSKNPFCLPLHWLTQGVFCLIYMPRNRQIKADFWSDEKIGRLSAKARLLFIGTWNFADDSGVCRANTTYLRNNIFPYDNINDKTIHALLTECSRQRLVMLTQSNGEEYLVIRSFNNHQKINRPSSFRYIKDLDVDSLPTHQSLTEASLPNVNVNVNVNENVNVNVTGFDLFWKEYPRKKTKGQAEKAWEKIKPSNGLLEIILEKLEEAKASVDWKKDNGQFIPYPATWLNGRGWEDEHIKQKTVADFLED